MSDNESLSFLADEHLKDAYGRMTMDDQPWARHSKSELQAMQDICGGFDGKNILDAGCGQGRHVLALLELGAPHSILGVDMSPRNIEIARGKLCGQKHVTFQTGDLRVFSSVQKYGLILCLYDVIGSFPEPETNKQIMHNLWDCCLEGGCLVLSVMNYELTLANVLKENYGDIQNNPQILFNLPPSDTMQSPGDIFDPRYYAIDSGSGLVYRKEQFQDGDSLHAEYVIRDKRYTRREIIDLAVGCGFDVIDSRYVQAGHWDKPLEATDKKAKEILLVLRKPVRD